jgi:hypothetical protein
MWIDGNISLRVSSPGPGIRLRVVFLTERRPGCDRIRLRTTRLRVFFHFKATKEKKNRLGWDGPAQPCMVKKAGPCISNFVLLSFGPQVVVMGRKHPKGGGGGGGGTETNRTKIFPCSCLPCVCVSSGFASVVRAAAPRR